MVFTHAHLLSKQNSPILSCRVIEFDLFPFTYLFIYLLSPIPSLKLLVYEHAFCRRPIAKRRSRKNNPKQSVGSQTSFKKDQERWKYKSDHELISIFKKDQTFQTWREFQKGLVISWTFCKGLNKAKWPKIADFVYKGNFIDEKWYLQCSPTWRTWYEPWLESIKPPKPKENWQQPLVILFFIKSILQSTMLTTIWLLEWVVLAAPSCAMSYEDL